MTTFISQDSQRKNSPLNVERRYQSGKFDEIITQFTSSFIIHTHTHRAYSRNSRIFFVYYSRYRVMNQYMIKMILENKFVFTRLKMIIYLFSIKAGIQNRCKVTCRSILIVKKISSHKIDFLLV